MLASFIQFIKIFAIPLLCILGILIVFAALRRPQLGLYLMAFLIPQANIWHKLYNYPLGKDYLDILFVVIMIGVFATERRNVTLGGNSKAVICLLLYSYIGLWISSFNFNQASAIDISNLVLIDWKNYAIMPCLYLLVFFSFRRQENQKILLLIMCLVLLIICLRSFRNFSPSAAFGYGKRAEGPFWAVGLGANHFGAFVINYIAVFIGLLLCDGNKIRKWFYSLAIFFSMFSILFSYSRGAYVAAFGVICIFGVLKKRSLLILAIILLMSWTFILPKTVVERISMTQNDQGQLESSAAKRLTLWDSAIELYDKSPIFGVGFDGFMLSGAGKGFTDTHNYFLKKLCEEGIIGLMIFLFCLFKALLSGWKLYRNGKTPFHRGLGLGFFACVFSIIVTNFFGNRFSYFVMGSYFFIFWALVDSSLISLKQPEGEADGGSEALPRHALLEKLLA